MIRGTLHRWLFGLLVRMCERMETRVVGAAANTGDTVSLSWSASSVPSVSKRVLYPFIVFRYTVGRARLYVTLSPEQAMLLCSEGERMIKDQMAQFGHTKPLAWDTTGSKFRFTEDDDDDREKTT